MKNIPKFDIETTNGSVSLIFQTKSHKCIMRFLNETLQIEIDGVVVFETGK